MNRLLPLGSTIVLLGLLSHSLTAQLLGGGLLGSLDPCSSDVYSPVPDNAVRDGWREYAEIVPLAGMTGGEFGHSVRIHGNYAVVGAPQQTINGTSSGAAYVYRRTQDGWSLQATLTPTNEAGKYANDRFGKSVAILGSTIIVGAPGDEDANSHANAGAVYVFERTGTSWTQSARFHPAQRTKNDEFGFSVSLNSAGAWVGALTKETGDKSSGSAYFFARSGNSWTEGPRLLPQQAHLSGSFGYSIAANATNTRVIIGAPTEDINGVPEVGMTYVYAKGTTGWYLEIYGYGYNTAPYDHFGESLSYDGTTLAVSAPGTTGTDNAGGKVYLVLCQVRLLTLRCVPSTENE